jgi:hypothetical protein
MLISTKKKNTQPFPLVRLTLSRLWQCGHQAPPLLMTLVRGEGSTESGAAPLGLDAAAMGDPHFGHCGARSDTELPQSGQVISDTH